ncbi:MAG: TldD/PmbA family protein [Acidimicrobiales bacterium]
MSGGTDIPARLAEEVLDRVRAATDGAAEAEVTAGSSSLALTRFANSFIHQNVADEGAAVRLRLHLDGRTATGSTTRVSSDGLTALVERTIAASRLLPLDPGWGGLAPMAPATAAGNVDEATAAVAPSDRAEVVRRFVDAAEGLEAAGYCKTTSTVTVFANSAGHTLSGASTTAAVDGVVRTGTSDGVARQASVALSELDGSALGARAATKARAAADAVDLDPGEYEVVLEPNAARDVLTNLAFYGFNGRAVAERRSFVRVGEQQFDPAITLVDDATVDSALGLPFDVEGTPKRPVTLVESGLVAAITHDRRTAKEVGHETTGHAIPGGERWGAIATNLRLDPSGDGRSIDDLVAGVERGLLVTDIWYTRVLDPRTLVVTGLTRNGLFVVEDGKLTGAVKNLRFTQSYPRALAPGAVLGVGGELAIVPDEWDIGATAVPALRLASWNFTGGAAG